MFDNLLPAFAERDTAMQNRIDALIAAQEILMTARIATAHLKPVHNKLCRIMAYLDCQASELLSTTDE